MYSDKPLSVLRTGHWKLLLVDNRKFFLMFKSYNFAFEKTFTEVKANLWSWHFHFSLNTPVSSHVQVLSSNFVQFKWFYSLVHLNAWQQYTKKFINYWYRILKCVKESFFFFSSVTEEQTHFTHYTLFFFYCFVPLCICLDAKSITHYFFFLNNKT